MGNAWDRTVLIAVSEFGRTVHANGTGGSDHGTAGVVLLAGGQILTEWPALTGVIRV